MSCVSQKKYIDYTGGALQGADTLGLRHVNQPLPKYFCLEYIRELHIEKVEVPEYKCQNIPSILRRKCFGGQALLTFESTI
jgi:hypothetical protein